MSDIFSRLWIKLSMGFNMQCNKLLNDNKSIPQKCFYTQHQNGNSLVVENNFNPIFSGPCVHSGTKFKVLIVFFVENKQQDDSFHLFTIIKTNKTKTLFSVFSIEYIFLPQGD